MRLVILAGLWRLVIIVIVNRLLRLFRLWSLRRRLDHCRRLRGSDDLRSGRLFLFRSLCGRRIRLIRRRRIILRVLGRGRRIVLVLVYNCLLRLLCFSLSGRSCGRRLLCGRIGLVLRACGHFSGGLLRRRLLTVFPAHTAVLRPLKAELTSVAVILNAGSDLLEHHHGLALHNGIHDDVDSHQHRHEYGQENACDYAEKSQLDFFEQRAVTPLFQRIADTTGGLDLDRRRYRRQFFSQE